MRAFKTACYLFLLVLIGGCWDAMDLEHMYYAHALGIDYREGKYEVYAQVVNFQAMPSGGQGQTFSGTPAYVGRAAGESIVEAIHQLYRQAERRIYWGHLASVIFTEKALQHEKTVLETFEVLGRFHEFRNTMWVFATRSPLADLLSTFPKAELSVIFSTFGEPQETYQHSSFIAPVRLHRYLARMTEPGYSNLFPVMDVLEHVWVEEENKPHKNLSNQGVAIVQDQTFKGYLNNEEILGIRWSQKETKRTPVFFPDAKSPMGSLIVYKPKMKIIPHIKDEQITFTITLKANAFLIELFEDIGIGTIQREAAEIIKKEIRHTYEKGLELDADLFQLSHSLYKKHPQVWRERSIRGKLPLTKDSIEDIQVKLRVIKTGKDKFRYIGESKTPINYWNKRFREIEGVE